MLTNVAEIPELLPAGLRRGPRRSDPNDQGWSWAPPRREPLPLRAQAVVDEIKVLSHWGDESYFPGCVIDVDLEKRAILFRDSEEHISQVWAAIEQLRECARQRGR